MRNSHRQLVENPESTRVRPVIADGRGYCVVPTRFRKGLGATPQLNAVPAISLGVSYFKGGVANGEKRFVHRKTRARRLRD
jgi:hypothetical protein